MSDQSQREALWLFRERVYWAGCDRRRDALFDLLDALVTAGPVPSFVHLSLALLFRRGWGSAYDALAAGRLDEAALREIVASYPLDDGAPIYALDTSLWTRNDAETSPERGLLLLGVAPLGAAAHPGGLVVRVAGAAELHARQLDRPIGRAARAANR